MDGFMVECIDITYMNKKGSVDEQSAWFDNILIDYQVHRLEHGRVTRPFTKL